MSQINKQNLLSLKNQRKKNCRHKSEPKQLYISHKPPLHFHVQQISSLILVLEPMDNNNHNAENQDYVVRAEKISESSDKRIKENRVEKAYQFRGKIEKNRIGINWELQQYD